MPAYPLYAVLFLAFIIFGVLLASFIYHWRYFGVSSSLRFFLSTAFISVSMLLLLSAGGIALRFF